MSAAVGTSSASKEMGFDNGMEIEELMKNKINNVEATGSEEEEEEEDEEEENDSKVIKSLKELDIGPQVSFKKQLEKDKDDDSLRRWKEQLLGSIDLASVGESKEAEVKIIKLSISCPGRADIVLPISSNAKSKRSLFTLREGTHYRLNLSFAVSNNIVSGLIYTNTVWKAGVRVDHKKVMLGTFGPKQEPYTCGLEEETIPSGILARGSYSATTKCGGQ
ncbi:rho GDP-dissociation inhibitor 1 isoform X2 [Hevea brasiliensis]|uniref:rho GDP-dissociation inhibitor 1 isoform X2 n=1 Tax=Hevea brasiliensis TaxID=3981 RepID=UPI0025D63765|nr:rho GDP-dissociation inhibitor 1 isoform X2 [Hevea brasiliensis]